MKQPVASRQGRFMLMNPMFFFLVHLKFMQAGQTFFLCILTFMLPSCGSKRMEPVANRITDQTLETTGP